MRPLIRHAAIRHGPGEAGTAPGRKKGKKSQFGDTLHTLIDKEWHSIRRVTTTTASLRDSRINLSKPGETVYRDKGYFGVKPAASMDKTIHRALRCHPLSIREKRRNRAIGRTRALGERPCAVIKRHFNAGLVLVTTVTRGHLANVIACFNSNLLQLRTIQGKERAERKLLRADSAERLGGGSTRTGGPKLKRFHSKR